MELPPEHNSFRRLLTYRIAQRFGLTHAAVSDPSNEVTDYLDTHPYFMSNSRSTALSYANCMCIERGTGHSDLQDYGHTGS